MLSEISGLAIPARNRSYRPTVIPAKAGIYRQHEAWIPAFAGMTFWAFFMRSSSMNVFVFAE
jgi:hypothetical protein